MVKKYGQTKTRLFHADATTFNILSPSKIGAECRELGEFTVTNTVKPFHACRLIRNDPQYQSIDLLYDKVLVDAECTHDGSFIHMRKQSEYEWRSFQDKFIPDRISALQDLQVLLCYQLH